MGSFGIGAILRKNIDTTTTGAVRFAKAHILLESHEILISDGIGSESFYPGPTALRMLPRRQREEIRALFPGLKQPSERGYGPPARRCLKFSEARRMAKVFRLGAKKSGPALQPVARRAAARTP